MTASTKDSSKKKKNPAKKDKNRTMEILYQRMGGRWYAFSVMDDDVYIGEVDTRLLDEIKNIHVENAKK